jgi:hypothetical protein
MKMENFIVLILFAGHCFLLQALPYPTRRIDSRDGLSNSAILLFYHNNIDFLWLGTYNGLDRYDGKFIKAYNPCFIFIGEWVPEG